MLLVKMGVAREIINALGTSIVRHDMTYDDSNLPWLHWDTLLPPPRQHSPQQSVAHGGRAIASALGEEIDGGSPSSR